MSSILSSSSIISSATAAFPTALPTGTISALIGHPPNTTNDYYIVAYLNSAFGRETSPMKGIIIPPLAPPDYVFESRSTSLLIAMSISIFFMFSFTLLRLLIRLLNRGLVLGLDDLFIVPGVILAMTWPVLQILAVVYGGAGKHIWDVTYEEYGYFKRYTNLSKMFFFVSVGVVKISICLFNRRLTAMTTRRWLWFNHAFLVFLVVYILVSLFWTIFSCDPVWGGWDAIRLGREGVTAKCFPVSTLGPVLSTVHVVTDFGLLAVPLIVLWKVKMGWRTRGRLYIVFAVGGASMIGSIFRQIKQAELESDVLWSFKSLADWTLVDLTLGVIAASLPVLSAIIPAKWKSVHTSSSYKFPTNHRSHPLSHAENYPRSKFTGKNGRDIMGGRNGRNKGIKSTPSGTFGESEENIVRTDVIELSYRSKVDVEQKDEEEEEEENAGKEEGNREGCSVGKIKRSFSRKRNRGDSVEKGLDKGSDWHGGDYSHKVEISRNEP
ncbi:1d81be43-b448-4a37-9b05-cc6433123aa6 [Sclerotinia trifoliorum]|uniref:1d81be43-b448-4a37-9b05-cc6433123aa6 n=1 Tax=Sclerotinia trifoliorum TaxID=28548 RepID=A0A8H2VVG5_9HELO|nr:1d81be43-b448-4a37-9b05-cc6433123aa6 [Sclerotinia trifoliorum]